MHINKNKSKRERERGGGSNGFCPLLSLSISPIHAGIAFPFILACADLEWGGGSLNFLYSHIVKLPKIGLGLLEKFLDPRMYREWLKCMHSKIEPLIVLLQHFVQNMAQ